MANPSAIFEHFLQMSGLNPGAFDDLIDRAVRGDWDQAQFTMQVYSTKQFKSMFPGIFRKDGSMRMDPFQYRQLSDQYISSARTFGITKLGKDRIGSLIAGNVSMQEFSDRMTAVQRIEQYKPAFDEFKQILKSRGIKGSWKIDSDKDILDAILGKKPKQFYSIWDELVTGTAARSAGVDVSQKLIKSIAKRQPGIASEAELQANFQNLAANIKTLMPLSKIGKYGLTNRDLTTLEFGGPNQAAIADKVQKIIKQEEGFHQDRALTSRTDFGRSLQQNAQTA